MILRIDSAAVLGAGVMGSALAAHLANAGMRTHLLDVLPAGLAPDAPQAQRNQLAIRGLEQAKKAKPAAFYDPNAASLVTPGNFVDHLERLRDCDLVIEAVVERLDVKQSLFGRIAPYIKDGALVVSNTSGLSVAAMSEALPATLRERFLGMHFFNPVRYMHLLELIAAPNTSVATMQRAERIGAFLGKGVVHCKDTSNFIANRIGMHAFLVTAQLMGEHGLSIEEVDKIAGKAMGRPATAVFNTADLVGLDTFAHVTRNCYEALVADEERELFRLPSWMQAMVDSGCLGRKSGGGFYKKVGDEILVRDLQTHDYRPQRKVRFDALGATKSIEQPSERLRALVDYDDQAGRFAFAVLARTFAYASRRLGEIADDILNIDNAMTWGFNWEQGPFAAWDAMGVPKTVARMQQQGIAVAPWVNEMLASGRTSFYAEETYWEPRCKAGKPMPRDAAHLALAPLRRDRQRVIKENLGASLVDLADGCLCFEVHTKMNTIDGDVIELLGEAVSEAERNYEALVIGNDGEHFGAGANLLLIYMAAQNQAWAEIERVVRAYQSALQRLRYAKVPSVAAPFGYTFAGAAEMVLSSSAAQAHAETYMGLVEVGAGLVPSGCGCLHMVQRWTADVAAVDGVDVLPLLGQGSLQVVTAKVATSAEEARRMRYLRDSDGISWQRSRLLHDAKQRALGLARAGYRPPIPRPIKAAGFDAGRTLSIRVWSMVEGGQASAHDGLIANKVAHIMTGGTVAAATSVDEQHYLDLECEAFLSLCGEEKTQARMQSLLMTGKPLRN